MSPTPQVNIRIPLEAHELIRRLGELIRSRPDMVPALEKSVCDLESLAESLPPTAPMGASGLLDLLEDFGRRLHALEVGLANAAPPVHRHEPLNPRATSPVAQLRRKAGLPGA